MKTPTNKEDEVLDLAEHANRVYRNWQEYIVLSDEENDVDLMPEETFALLHKPF